MKLLLERERLNFIESDIKIFAPSATCIFRVPEPYQLNSEKVKIEAYSTWEAEAATYRD